MVKLGPDLVTGKADDGQESGGAKDAFWGRQRGREGRGVVVDPARRRAVADTPVRSRAMAAKALSLEKVHLEDGGGVWCYDVIHEHGGSKQN